MSAPEQQVLSGLALIARQPIMDAQMGLVAYELLYRTPTGQSMGGDTDPDAATSSVLVDALLELGLERISGGLPIHVNFAAGMLEHVSSLVIPPAQLVIEVLEDTVGSAAVVGRLNVLRAEGYRVALDDYVPGHADPRLIDCADLVKLDLGVLSAADAVTIAGQMRGRGIDCVAEKVETREQFDICVAGGIGLFQGYFLQRPETFFGRRAEMNIAAAMRLLAQLHDAEWAPRAVERLIASDIGLAYRLLRAVQSAGLFLPRRIENLSQAIIVLGRDYIIRIIALVLLSRCKDRPAELMRNALLRARLAEVLAQRARLELSSSYFMAGLLSLVPAMLGREPAEALADLPVSREIHDGVIRGEGSIGLALACAHALERAQWEHVHFKSLSPLDIREAYLEACAWLEEFTGVLADR
jgi:EAL and modified HD-GYP domain-containing signal transduction protein